MYQVNSSSISMSNNIELTEDQTLIMDSYRSGKNIFITGPGGCGKSFIIKEIVNDANLNNKNLVVTAMTGCASILLQCGAKTIHSWSGIGIANMSDDALTTKIMMNSKKRKNWRETDILVIDEMSMMSKRMFELLNHIGQRIRKSAQPFGGIQLICCGDFFQLPPVGNSKDPDSIAFCFESPLWNDVYDEQILLDKLFRQKDSEYIEILHQVRQGSLDRKSYNTLQKRIYHPVQHDSSDDSMKYAVHLFPTKSKANEMNYTKMISINEPKMVFTAKETLPQNPKTKMTKTQINMEIEAMYKHALFDRDLILKKGCKVMCIVNLDIESEIVNGSVGEIIQFTRNMSSTSTDINQFNKDLKHMPEYLPVVKFQNGDIRTISPHSWFTEHDIAITQIPLILAWGITIHKSQGATLENAIIDLGKNVFEKGQSYVALSRVKSLSGLHLTSFDPTKIRANDKVKEYYEQFYE